MKCVGHLLQMTLTLDREPQSPTLNMQFEMHRLLWYVPMPQGPNFQDWFQHNFHFFPFLCARNAPDVAVRCIHPAHFLAFFTVCSTDGLTVTDA
jgi:hypothetical protein